jgi:hypothetical protein
MLVELPGAGKKTVGADKNHDTAAFVAAARERNVTLHVAQNITRASRLEHRRADDAACGLPDQPGHPQTDRGGERVDQAVGGMAQTRFRGLARVGWMLTLKTATYNLIRLPGTRVILAVKMENWRSD